MELSTCRRRSHGRGPRAASAVGGAALALVVLGGCSGATAPNGSSALVSSRPTAPAPSLAPTASVDPGPPVALDVITRDPATNDGKTVRIQANYINDGKTSRLCGAILESYPPQCGGATIRLTGRIPDAVVAGLSTTTEPGLAKAWWGFVVATGTFHAAGADGVPTLDPSSMTLKQG